MVALRDWSAVCAFGQTTKRPIGGRDSNRIRIGKTEISTDRNLQIAALGSQKLLVDRSSLF